MSGDEFMYPGNYSEYKARYDTEIESVGQNSWTSTPPLFSLNNISPSPSNWYDNLSKGSKVYSNEKFGRSQDLHDLKTSKNRATDIKKLIRSQCIYNSAVDPRSLKTNSDYVNTLYHMGGSRDDRDNLGILLTKTYDEGTQTLIKYLESVSPSSNLYDRKPGTNWYDGENIMPFDITKEGNSPENDWKYAFNNLYYPLEDEYLASNGEKTIDTKRGLMKFGSGTVTCVKKNKDDPDNIDNECRKVILDVADKDGKEEAYFQCVNKGSSPSNRYCKLNVNLDDNVMYNTDQKFRKGVLNQVSGGNSGITENSRFFKRGDDFGDGLYGRWDSVNNLCGQQYTRCRGTIDNQGTLSQIGISNGKNECTNYFYNLKKENKIGNQNIDATGINNVTDKELCETSFLSDGNPGRIDLTSIGDGGGGRTGCTYHAQPPDYYKDLNLVDKCSVDDLYEKLQSSGMRQVDLDKIEFTAGCPRRQIGYDLDFACSDESGRFLSKSQTVEKCTGKDGSSGTLEGAGDRATDCVNPAVLKAFNELTDLDGGHPIKNEDKTWRRYGTKTDAVGAGLLKILNNHGPEHELNDDILKNECYWQPILKEKEYVDEDSSCILRCKDGAVQNGSQPYCKSAPDFDVDGSYNIGYLNPYLNPEWDLNNFSCTAIEDKACTDAKEETFDDTMDPNRKDTAGHDRGEEDVASVTRTWNESKQMYETKIQRCRNKTGTVEIFGITITKVNLFLIIAIVNSICLVFVIIHSGFFFRERKRRKGETTVAHARAADPTDAGMDAAGAAAVAAREYSGKETGMQILEIICFSSIASISIYMAIVKPTLDIPEDSLIYAVITMGCSSLSLLISSISGHKFAGILLYIGIHAILYQQYTKFNEKFNYSTTETMMYSKPESETKTGLEYAIRSNSFIFGQFWVFLFCIFSFFVLVVCHFGEVHQIDLGWLLEGIISPIAGLVITSIFYFFWGWATGQPFGPVKPGVSDTPGTPSEYSKTTIPAHKCHQYSDCKYHDNCLWDEIVSIIDGPQDYIYNRTHELDPGYQMTEIMYGFIYLINKYPQCGGDSTKPCFKAGSDEDSWNTLFNPDISSPSNTNRAFFTGSNATNTTPGAAYDTSLISNENNIYKWVDGWSERTEGGGKKVLIDNSGNKILIRDLLKEYGIQAKKSHEGEYITGEETLKKIFWYYWSYFYDPRTGYLRTEIQKIAYGGEGEPYKIDESSIESDLRINLSEFYSNLLVKNSGKGPNPDDVRRCIPVFRIIFKDWLYENLKVPFNGKSDGKGKFSGCELNNKVCTYGVNENTGECNESCENDELLDYSQGLCLNTDGTEVKADTDKYVKHMRHRALLDPATDGKHSLREFGPNFQRFYCEMKKNSSGNESVIKNDSKYYQKAGCIKNDFLNHNAIPGETCGDYRERSESSGYNIDCNHDNSRVHYQYYTSNELFDIKNNQRHCVTQFDSDHKNEDLMKVCGYDFNSASQGNYKWNDSYSISVDTFSKGINLTINPYQARYKNTTGYEDISPILSCCEPSDHRNVNANCLQGQWNTIADSDKGYCSLSNSGNRTVVEAAEDLNMTNSEVCKLFKLDSSTPGCETCAGYRCHIGSNESNPAVNSMVYSDFPDPELACCRGPECSSSPCPGTHGRNQNDPLYFPESPCPSDGRCPTRPSPPPS